LEFKLATARKLFDAIDNTLLGYSNEIDMNEFWEDVNNYMG
jgi:hypothetical protein